MWQHCFCTQTVWRVMQKDSRDEHRTGLGLDWTRTMTNFVDFGLDPACKMLHKFRIRTGFGLSLLKKYVISVNKKLYFVKFLDLDFEFLKLFALSLDLDRVLKIQDWIRIAKSDSPLISARQ